MKLNPFAPSTYLVDFAVYKPPDDLRIDKEEFAKAARKWDSRFYTKQQEEWARKILFKSGLDENGTYLPRQVHAVHQPDGPKSSPNDGYDEAVEVMCGAMDILLEKTGLQVKDIDVVITHCSIYCQTPSFASMLVNKYKMRSDIQSWHLSGMGCAAGVILISMIDDMLKATPNLNIVFVPAEVICAGYYRGLDVHRMLANVIFRMGGAAAFFSNRPEWVAKSKYELVTYERVQCAGDDEGFRCMHWGPDSEGFHGMYLSKDLVKNAAKALSLCVRNIAPRILDWPQLLKAAWVEVQRRVLKRQDVPPFQPDFLKTADYFAIHAGGFAVLKGVQQGMGLPNYTMVPCFAALRDYGNTSGSTTWYVMAYLESCADVKKGQKIMQCGMGGGMKVGVNMWRARRDVHEVHTAWKHLEGKPLTEADLPRNIDAVVAERTAKSNPAPSAPAVAAIANNAAAEATKSLPSESMAAVVTAVAATPPTSPHVGEGSVKAPDSGTGTGSDMQQDMGAAAQRRCISDEDEATKRRMAAIAALENNEVEVVGL